MLVSSLVVRIVGGNMGGIIIANCVIRPLVGEHSVANGIHGGRVGLGAVHRNQVRLGDRGGKAVVEPCDAGDGTIAEHGAGLYQTDQVAIGIKVGVVGGADSARIAEDVLVSPVVLLAADVGVDASLVFALDAADRGGLAQNFHMEAKIYVRSSRICNTKSQLGVKQTNIAGGIIAFRFVDVTITTTLD